ncbi:FAD/NAD(P)-binding domain-containing protein [Apiospora arundinis]
MASESFDRDIERDSATAAPMAQNGQQNGGQHGPKDGDRPKRVLIVGAGAAGMSAAYHLTQQPGQFDVTLIDAVDYCGGQAFSIPLDKDRHGASWCNQGVQGGSYIFHHTATMFARQGYRADPVDLQVSFGKDDAFWTNVFPTQLLARHQKEIARLVTYLKVMRWFEVLFALLPLRLVFKLGGFSDEFTNTIALPMTALFLGTGNATPEVPTIMFERLCTSPTYGMWYAPDKHTVVSNQPPMIVFPKLSDFYSTWKDDLVSRGVTVRLSTELTEIVKRDKKHGVVVKLKPRTPAPDHHNPAGGDPNEPSGEETFDELILCCLADTAKKVLGKTASWREKKVLGSAKFSDDVTITHNDADYMKRHYENFYREDLAVATMTSQRGGVEVENYQQRLDWAADNFRPMYYIKMYPSDRSKLEMCFDTTNYQSQFPERVPFEQHVFQTIYLNKARDSHLWSDDQIDESKIIRKDWWHQLCHSYTHYLFVVPWVMFLQARRHVRFAGSWTLVNAHEVAILSGLAAAVDLGAEYPEDLEHDRFAFLAFRLYYLLAYGKWYRRRYTSSSKSKKNAQKTNNKNDDDDGLSQKAKDGQSWATGLYGSVYKGPGVSETARSVWKEDVKKGLSTDNLAEKNAPGRSQP